MRREIEGETASAGRLAFRLGRAVGALGAFPGAALRLLRRIRFRRERGSQPASRPTACLPASKAAIRQGTPDLTRSLVSPDPLVRIASLRSLVDNPGPERGRLLAAALVDPEEDVRRTAAELVGDTKAEESVFSLLLALEDPSAEVRQAAEQAVAGVTGRELAATDTPEQRRERIAELKRWWKEQRYSQLARGWGEGS
jgi:hypothetical protein